MRFLRGSIVSTRLLALAERVIFRESMPIALRRSLPSEAQAFTCALPAPQVSIKEFAFAHLDFTFENKQELMSYVMSRLALGSSAEAHTPAARLRSIVQGERVAERLASKTPVVQLFGFAFPVINRISRSAVFTSL